MRTVKGLKGILNVQIGERIKCVEGSEDYYKKGTILLLKPNNSFTNVLPENNFSGIGRYEQLSGREGFWVMYWDTDDNVEEYM